MAGSIAGSLSTSDERSQAAPPMPVLLTARHGCGSGGVAFEVPIKNPEAAKLSTPGKLRLEAYGNSRLSPHGGRKSPTGGQQRCLRHEAMAEKARESNEKARMTAQRVRAELDESAEAKRRDLEQDQEEKQKRREAQLAMQKSRPQRLKVAISRRKQMGDDVVQKIERASEKRREVLADRSSKAGRHFEDVKIKTEVHQQCMAEEHAARAKQLESALAAKAALHDAGVAERGERAGHYNDAVAEKVQKHLQEVQKHNAELLAKHRQKSGSKIDGRPHQFTNEEATSSRKTSVETASRGALKSFASRLVTFLPCHC